MDIDRAVAEQAFAVVERTIAAINAGDGDAVTGTLNFPHFRIGSTGNVIH